MKLRTYTTFEADFPDDAEFTENGDIKHPGGLKIARVLGELLESRGLKVSAPKQHSFYGWAFVVRDHNYSFWFLLQFPGPWLLLSQNRTSWIQRLFRSKPLSQHRRTLEILNESLRQDGRFRNIQWYHKQYYEQGKGRLSGEKIP